MLKQLALEKGISVEEIAQKLGKTTVSVYRDYRKADLNTEVIRKYCEVMNIKLSSLFVDEDSLALELSKKQKEIESLKSELEKMRKWTEDKDKIIRLYEDKMKRDNPEE